MVSRAVAFAFVALLAAGCFFPGNPTGRSSNSEPDPDCPVSSPVGKPCKPDRMQFCVSKSWRYECYDDEWHRSG